MKYVLILMISVLASFADAQENVLPSESEQATAAAKILEAYHQTDPVAGQRSLKIISWTPKGRDFPADQNARLDRIMKHIQAFYASEMKRLGLGERSFNLETDDQGQLVLHRITGRHPEMLYSMDSGYEIRRECKQNLKESGIDIDQETIVIFCNLATWDEEKLTFEHNSPYYAMGNCRQGTAWQLDSPELDIPNLRLKEPLITDGQYGRISLGQHNSIFIGGIAHELGHALGLPHNKQRRDQAVRGTALMGSGNRTYGEELRGESRGSFLTLAHGLRLASHPQFSNSIKGLEDNRNATISDLKMDCDGKTLHVSGKVTGTPPVYAVVAYFDPASGSDYDALTATAVPDAAGRFKMELEIEETLKRGEFRMFPLNVNGDTLGISQRTKYKFPFQVSEQGEFSFTADAAGPPRG